MVSLRLDRGRYLFGRLESIAIPNYKFQSTFKSTFWIEPMRHRRRGRTLGRNSSHRRALLRNLATCLFLTERDELFYEGLTQADGKTEVKPPAHKGRIVTTIHKAKEVRPLVEKCITLAKKALPHQAAAAKFAVDAERNSDEWRKWRNSDQWQQWCAAMAPALAARRRALQLLGSKEAVAILFEDVAPRFVERPGGFTRILQLAKPRLGDAGTQAILEFVGENDRVKKQAAAKPAFAADSDSSEGDAGDASGTDDAVADEPAVKADA